MSVAKTIIGSLFAVLASSSMAIALPCSSQCLAECEGQYGGAFTYCYGTCYYACMHDEDPGNGN